MSIKAARESKGYSQKELAELMGVSQPTVCDWETGKKNPAGKNLKKLSTLLGCTTDYLIMDDAARRPISDDEVKKLIQFAQQQGEVDEAAEADVLDTIERVNKPDAEKGNKDDYGDELLPDAIELVVDQGAASVSMLQRRFRIGYNRAARIVDMMEERQVVGPPDGSRPRQVLITREDLENMKD